MKNILRFVGLVIGMVTLTVSASTVAPLGNLPLFFEANASDNFIARGHDAQF